MLEIVLSDITVMGQGYCVIGLEHLAPGSIRSVRPRPLQGFAWRDPFPFGRGASINCNLTPIANAAPHIEDRQSTGLLPTGRSLSEDELIQCLNYAEVSTDLRGLFGCALKSDTRGGNWWADRKEAIRSICGCLYTNIWFQVIEEPERTTLRARMALPSNERLNSVPVVDREWRRFLRQAAARIKEAGRPYGAEQFLNRFIRRQLLRSLKGFARIGLARPEAQSGKCWLMLDSLFPQPRQEWLEGLVRRQ
jgi:hypothetical protein